MFSWSVSEQTVELTMKMPVIWDTIALIMTSPYFEDFCNSFTHIPWWRHQMETISVLLAICAGNSLVTGEFPTQRPTTRSFDVFFDLHPNKRLSKQWWSWWFETPSRPLWRQCNAAGLHPWQFTKGFLYSISQEICTRFCCALLCCGYAIVHNEFTWSIYPYSSGLLCWHWGNR